MDYYNEWDKFAAQWMRELQIDGELPPGPVDERSIEDVAAEDLENFQNVHFFAGIGGWPLALRLAGWPASWPVWTGSCPCQPFSVAGTAGTVGDERHLWPAFRRLISECRPPVVFGEQVASKDGRYWLAGVRDDLERMGYAVGAADLCAAGVGAPHIRQRLYWVAYSDREGRRLFREPDLSQLSSWNESHRRVETGRVADAQLRRSEQRDEGKRGVQEPDAGRGMGEPFGAGLEGHAGDGDLGTQSRWDDADEGGSVAASGAWARNRVVECRDGKRRRVPLEPSLFPVAPRFPGRVGLLRGAGGSIVPQLAAEFVKAFMEAIR